MKVIISNVTNYLCSTKTRELVNFIINLLWMFISIFYLVYGVIYVINFFILYFRFENNSTYSEEQITGIIKYGVESPNVITISIGIVIFLFIHNLGFSNWLMSRKKILFVENRLIYRMFLYSILLGVLISITSLLSLSISKLINTKFGHALDYFYFWFYWAAVIPGVHSLLRLFEVKKRLIKLLVYSLVVLAFVFSFLYYRNDKGIQLLFQHFGNSLVLLSFGVHVLAGFLAKNRRNQRTRTGF